MEHVRDFEIYSFKLPGKTLMNSKSDESVIYSVGGSSKNMLTKYWPRDKVVFIEGLGDGKGSQFEDGCI